MEEQSIFRRGSFASRVLEDAWQRLMGMDPRIPPVVIVLLCSGSRRRANASFAWSTWRWRGEEKGHEVGISPDLFHTAEDVLASLLHEAAHAILFPDHGGGCSRDGYYHRKEFRDTCRELGLECSFLNRRYGWTLTRWPAGGVPSRYAHLIDLLRELPPGTGVQSARPRPKGSRTPAWGLTKITCLCRRDGVATRSVHVSKSVLEEGGVQCAHCGVEFSTADG